MNRVPTPGVWVVAVLVTACAGVPPPVTEQSESPVSPSAEEAPWNPQFRYLETATEAESSDPSMSGTMEHGSMEHSGMEHGGEAMEHSAPETSAAGHEGHAMDPDPAGDGDGQ